MYEEEIDLRVYIDVLLRRRRLIIALTLGMALIAMVVSFLLPVSYKAEAALSVAPRRSNITLTEDFVLSEEEVSRLTINQRAEALTEIAKSLQVAKRVMETNPELSGEGTTPSAMVNTIEVSTKNDLLILTASADTPQKAAERANAWVEATRDQINRVYAFDPATVTEIQDQMNTSWEEYSVAQQALEAFLRESDVSALESRITIVQSLLDKYQQASADSTAARFTEMLLAQQKELNQLYDQKIEVQQQLINARTLAHRLNGTGNVITDTWGTMLALINLEADTYGGSPESLLQFDLGEDAPPLTASTVQQVVTSLENKLTEIERQITTVGEELGTTVSTTSPVVDESALQQQVKALTTELSTLQAQLEAQEARKIQLTEARDVAWTTYTSLSNKQREIKVQESVAASEARLAFEAMPPSSPSSPDKRTNTIVAGALGLMLGVFGAFMIEYLVPEPEPQAKQGLISRLLLSEASGLPNFDPDPQGKKDERPQE